MLVNPPEGRRRPLPPTSANSAFVMPLIHLAYVVLATLIAGASSPAAGFAIFALGLLAALVIEVLRSRQAEAGRAGARSRGQAGSPAEPRPDPSRRSYEAA